VGVAVWYLRNALGNTKPNHNTGPAVRPHPLNRTYVEALKTGSQNTHTQKDSDATVKSSRIEELLVRLINQNETMMQLLQTVILKLVK
jgi:hypothetical protein